MNNLGTILKLFFKKTPTNIVLRKKLDPRAFSRETFVQLMNAYVFYYSEDEANNFFAYYMDLFQQERAESGRGKALGLNVFDPLFYCSGECLTIQNNQVKCRYEKLKYWREMTLELGEDIFVAGYLAARIDPVRMMNEHFFLWKRVLGHNNEQLNQLIREGISENHFHLFGSVPIFQVSWLSLMNHVENPRMGAYLREYDQQRRYTNVQYSDDYVEQSLYHRYLQAALIRVFLYAQITGKRIRLGEYYVPGARAFGVLQMPEFQVNGKVVTLSTKKLKNVLCHFPQVEYPLAEMLTKLYLTSAEKSFKNREEAWRELNGDQRWRDLLSSMVGDRNIITSELLYELEKYGASGIITVKQLAYIMFSCTRGINLIEIDLPGKDEEAFFKLWNTKTEENVVCMVKNPKMIEDYLEDIQGTIDSFRVPIRQVLPQADVEIDYMLRQTCGIAESRENSEFLFSGERWLLYTMMRRVYRDLAETDWEYYLFYTYILLKEGIRSELVQTNPNVGFRNFQRYQGRKGHLMNDAIYQNASVKYALRESLLTENIRTIELRISPEESLADLKRQIMMLDNIIDPKGYYRHRFFYTLHFIKEKCPKTGGQELEIECRHAELRRKIGHLTKILTILREDNPKIAERILGIDSAGNEIGCRPEVFARYFRQLTQHISAYDDVEGLCHLPQIRATYHVGEDFLDLADGLRAIDEAIQFLNLDNGDRLGHVTALGNHVEEWYRSKMYKIAICQQDYLDNIVWVHQKLGEYHIDGFATLKKRLEKEYVNYFGRIYRNHMDTSGFQKMLLDMQGQGVFQVNAGMSPDYSLESYYVSMKLRGDEPGFYSLGYFDKRDYEELSVPETINRKIPVEYRYIPGSVFLYFSYHYNSRVRQEGEKTIQVKIEKDFIQAVEEIQKAMQRDIARRGIAIETNPSSNVLIGTFRDYKKHPILRFYNLGLVCDVQKLEECPQLHVSINTDDQGVFSTSLENEYALLAMALETDEDEQGVNCYKKPMVYDWLERIRNMGNEQSFGKEQYERVAWGK